MLILCENSLIVCCPIDSLSKPMQHHVVVPVIQVNQEREMFPSSISLRILSSISRSDKLLLLFIGIETFISFSRILQGRSFQCSVSRQLTCRNLDILNRIYPVGAGAKRE